MEVIITKKDRKLIRVVEKTISKWRKILHLDPLWEIHVTIVDCMQMEGNLARVDALGTEYYVANLDINESFLQVDEEYFMEKIEQIVCHELLHLVAVDFYRSAILASGKNEHMKEELKYRYEQFTTRLEKAFVDLYNKEDVIIIKSVPEQIGETK
jgi:hypothetical protein